jgi:16S rRNA (uracil1498-N3)-methyltransferase
LKSDKLETVFRMGSQLGTGAFHLFLSKRCIPHPGDAGPAGKMKRWEKIILDSVRISGRSIVPCLKYYDSLENLFKAVCENRKILFAYEKPGLPLLSDVLSAMSSGTFREESLSLHQEKERNQSRAFPFDGIILVTGPEGGFAREEADMAVRYGAGVCSLGEGILKAETAPVAALAVTLSFLRKI